MIFILKGIIDFPFLKLMVFNTPSVALYLSAEQLNSWWLLAVWVFEVVYILPSVVANFTPICMECTSEEVTTESLLGFEQCRVEASNNSPFPSGRECH